MSLLNVSAREAAAMDRLLDAYLATPDVTDPGVPDLQRLRRKLAALPMDQSAYERYFAEAAQPAAEQTAAWARRRDASA